MKKFLTILITAISIFATVGCSEKLDQEVNTLKERVTALEAVCNSLNSSISSANSLVKAIEANDFITKITPINNSGQIKEYLITFSSGSSITLTSGKDGIKPIVGISQYSDGCYYWTLQTGTGEPVWITNNLGIKIKASAIVPKMKVESNFWWISFDSGATWTKLSEAVGESGNSIFSRIDYSNEAFITFTLSDNSKFDVPTLKGFKAIEEKCNNINSEIEGLKTILTGIDKTVMIKSVSQIISSDKVVGYNFLLNNGSQIKVYNGKDGAPFLLGIQQDMTDFIFYWTIKYETDPKYNWLTDSKGKRIPATAASGSPIISAKDSAGVYYFTVKYTSSQDFTWLRDPAGNLIRANSYTEASIFDSVTINTSSATIVLKDKTSVTIPFYTSGNPIIVFGKPKNILDVDPTAGMTTDAQGIYQPGVAVNASYTITWSIAQAPGDTKVEVIGLDNCIVSGTTFSPDGTGFKGSITFKTPTEFPNGAQTSRILIFVTWDKNITMKVLEFKNIP